MIVMHIGNQTLGEKLRELRENYDLSQAQIAAALNIDRSTYSNYELDKTRPSLESLLKISRIYNVPWETFMPNVDPDEESEPHDIMQPNSMLQSLNKEERGLLALYRSLPRAQKKMILRVAKDIAADESVS